MTNGIMKSNGPSTINPARSTRQLPAILAALARLQMKQHRPMPHILQQAPFRQRGVSCVLFSYAYEEHTAESKHILQERSIPVTTFVSHTPLTTKSARQQNMTGVHSIEDIGFQGEMKS